MLYLRKNEKNIEVNKSAGNDRLPYFSLFLVPEKDSKEEWKEIGAFWKAKSGKGYTGQFVKGLEFNVEGIKQFKKNENTINSD